jgi:hypothetical protein
MVQQLAPSWVRARVLAAFLLVFQGCVTLGSFVWGLAAERRGIAFAFILASVGTAASILLRFFARLPQADVDLSPWIHWSAPTLAEGQDFGPDDGPCSWRSSITWTPAVPRRSSRQCTAWAG